MKNKQTSMADLAAATKKRADLGAELMLRQSQAQSRQIKLVAAETICERVGAMGWSANLDEELPPMLGQHIQLTAISAAYASAVERHMLSVFDRAICPAPDSKVSPCLADDHLTNSPEWLEQLAQLNLLF